MYEGDGLQTTVEGLVPGERYGVRVAAKNHDGTGEWSSELHSELPGKAAAAPEEMPIPRKWLQLDLTDVAESHTKVCEALCSTRQI